MCNLPAAAFADPNQAFGEKFGTQAQGPTRTPEQVALQVRSQMIDQALAVVKALLLTTSRRRRLLLPLRLPSLCSRK